MRKSDQVTAMTTAMKIQHDRAVSKADVTAFLEAYSGLIQQELETNGEFVIHGIGKLSVSQRGERQGRHPQTGAPMTIPASKGVKFSASKMLKDGLNGK